LWPVFRHSQNVLRDGAAARDAVGYREATLHSNMARLFDGVFERV